MKIIHCADIHLGSSLNSNFNSEKANERKSELFSTFVSMIEYAVDNDVEAVIIAGDLFDNNTPNKTLKKNVYQAIEKYPDIHFYYLKGNHDKSIDETEIPENMHLFTDKWTTYTLGESKKIKLTGVELNKNSSNYIYNTLNLNESDFNIVTLHGQESEHDNKNDAEIINLKELRNKHIDYLALGHIHSYKVMPLDSRGTYCYSGCLEGRGFDEAGDHGFVLLEVEEDSHKYEKIFVKFANRKIFHESIDVGKATSSMGVADIIKKWLKNVEYSKSDYAEFILTGEVNADSDIDTTQVEKLLENSLWYVKVKDKTSVKIDYKKYEMDESLKGEFVRKVYADENLDEQTKNQIIKYGFAALSGKEL